MPLAHALDDHEESMETINTWDQPEMPERADLDFDLLPLGIDLRQLLVQVTGQQDVEKIAAVKLKVHTIQAGLHRLAELTPRLRVLTLDDSCVNSLRDLGAFLKSLESLSVCRCGLKSLDGIWSFRKLKVFLARDNTITDISQCSSVDKLSMLDVGNNEIDDVTSFGLLKNCKRLRDLYVAGNRFDNYRELMIKLLPGLRVLDGKEIGGSTKYINGPRTLKNHEATSKDENSHLMSPENNLEVSSMVIKKNDDEDSCSDTNSDAKSQPQIHHLARKSMPLR